MMFESDLTETLHKDSKSDYLLSLKKITEKIEAAVILKHVCLCSFKLHNDLYIKPKLEL